MGYVATSPTDPHFQTLKMLPAMKVLLLFDHMSIAFMLSQIVADVHFSGIDA